ncbi:MAG TPA: FtsL-like putative cell division protein [Edaphocola sp.]|nr:FtsL-like putative cell division protein [Edaphocola sp.]
MEEQVEKKSKWIMLKEKFDHFSYKGVVLNVPFLIFIALLAVFYISNNNKGISIARAIEKKTKVLEEARWRYKDAQSNLIYRTSEKKLSEQTEKIGIKPLEKPAFEIKKVQEAKVKEEKNNGN